MAGAGGGEGHKAGDGFQIFTVVIINTLAGKEEYLIKEHQNIEVTKAIEAFYKSAELNREVNVRELVK